MNLTKPLLPLFVLALASACDQGATPIGGFDSDGCAQVSEDSGGAIAKEQIAIDCSFYYQGVQQSSRFSTDGSFGGTLTEVPISDTLEVVGVLSDTEIEGRSFSIRILTGDGALLTSTLYQMDPQLYPQNEFWGDHGFTGLNYTRDPANDETLQYACFASDPADPIHEWQN